MVQLNARFGVHDEYSPLKTVLVRRPGEEFANMDQYRKWGYQGEPNLEKAQKEHDQFTDLLKQFDVEVIYQQEVDPNLREPLFTRDPSIITDKGAIIGRCSNPLRCGEEYYAARTLLELGIPILFSVHSGATVDGGDTLWLDKDTFLVGRSYRTNDLAYRQLKAVMEGFVCKEVIQVPLPHFRGPGEVLHLMSVISPIDRDLAVVYPKLMPLSLIELLKDRGIEMIEVPDEEFDTQGSNVLAVAPRKVIMVAGNKETRKKLERAGCEVAEYEGEQISIIPVGGPTCLTRPILREED